MSAKPIPSVRWSVNQAAAEFAIDRDTLRKRLISLSIEPGEDAKFSTAQIIAAVFGDIAGEKLGKAKADRITAEVNAARALDKVMLANDAEALWADATTRTRGAIDHAPYLTEAQKDQLLADLAKIKLTETIPEDAT